MCERGCVFNAEMCERGCVFNAGFAGFCTVFRRGERGCASGDAFLTRRCASGDVFLTQGLQGSAQCFAGASGGMWLAGMCEQMLLTRGEFLTRGLRCSAQWFRRGERGCASGTVFFKIVGLRKNIGVTLS